MERLARESRLNQRLGEELADVLLYLLRLADVLHVDLPAAAEKKLRANTERFVVADCHGKAPERS